MPLGFEQSTPSSLLRILADDDDDDDDAVADDAADDDGVKLSTIICGCGCGTGGISSLLLFPLFVVVK